jgi:hypothetical protein
MTQIIGLFHDPAAVENAVNALNKAELDIDINIVEPGDHYNSTIMPPFAPVINPEGTTRSGVGAWAVVAMDDNKGLDAEESTFLQRHLEDGGMAVVVETETDDEQSFVRQVLEEHGGRVTAKT